VKTALVHDWLLSPVGGAENTLEAIYSLFPSPIYTLLWKPSAFTNTPLASAEVFSSFINKWPGAHSHFQTFLPLFPLGIEQFDLSAYDVVISSSHCVAHGALTHREQIHICYCHTPMRYAWDLMHEALRDSKLDKGLRGFMARLGLHFLRQWDVSSSRRADHFIANSKFIERRIEKIYGRKAEVIYPPVDTSYFGLSEKKEPFFITSSRLVPYKRVSLIVDAFSEMPDLELVVIGDGPEMKNIRKRAGKNIRLLGRAPRDVLRNYLQRAEGFIFAATEDFGIAPVEAMACGTPVIAFNKGGAKETVVDGVTGLFFEEQTAPAIQAAVRAFQKNQALFDPTAISKHASKFSKERFQAEFSAFVQTHAAARSS
jgi:glycosyltransferase involved in cell wall biosynthesis